MCSNDASMWKCIEVGLENTVMCQSLGKKELKWDNFRLACWCLFEFHHIPNFLNLFLWSINNCCCFCHWPMCVRGVCMLKLTISFHKKVGKVFIPGLPAPSLTMSNQMPRPSTPLDSLNTPSKPLNKHLGPLEEVREANCFIERVCYRLSKAMMSLSAWVCFLLD